eukprot:Nitzschia sp. Nitz4//scaffold126_size65214//33783//36208//NITZ4_006158-RA/size65214-snap-gene-0.52-mRNA-1//1//CDS//3329534695//488//frame0
MEYRNIPINEHHFGLWNWAQHNLWIAMTAYPRRVLCTSSTTMAMQTPTNLPHNHQHFHTTGTSSRDNTTIHEDYGERPSTLAAREFFADPPLAVTSFPHRLVQWVFRFDQLGEDQSNCSFSYSFSSDPLEARRQQWTASLLAHAPASSKFFSVVQSYFQLLLQENEEEDPVALDAKATIMECLSRFGWLHPMAILHQPLRQALHHVLHSHIQETIAQDYEQDDFFSQIQDYQQAVLLPTLTQLVPADWSSTLEYAAAESFCQVRQDEIFNIVAEYPHSNPAVQELKRLLDITQRHSALADALRESLAKRLNHPGAGTHQIIDGYINTIKVLRQLDPSDRLLHRVAEPVRKYLRRRHNTVRTIIASLTDPNQGGDLYEELRRQDAKLLENTSDDPLHEQNDDDEDQEPDMDHWQPPPPITKQRGTFFANVTNQATPDILAMLVSIYGTKELFVNEYRLLLADKLLKNLDFSTDREVHTLELLKLRFGEIAMRNCEIMIKDTDDSKRIVTNIQQTLARRDAQDRTDHIFDAIIVSHIFWPALQKDSFQHHPRLQSGLDAFSAEYARLKNPRRLVWLPPLGTVELELDVVDPQEDGTSLIETKEFSVSPLLATLIAHFEDKEEWTASDLANETGLDESAVAKHLTFWVSNRVLILDHTNNSYCVAARDHWVAPHDGQQFEDYSHTPAVAAAAQEEEDFAIYESYVCGMLHTQGELPLERIHNMLKMFATGSEVKYNKTPQQLSMLLQQLCKQDKIECGPDGMYKLIKK